LIYQFSFLVCIRKSFHNYEAIHWSSELITNEKGEVTFKVLNTLTNRISFYIEGMGEDGSLFSTRETIDINKQKVQ